MTLTNRLTLKDRDQLKHFGTLTVANGALIDYSETNRTGYLTLAELEAAFKAGRKQKWDCGTGACEGFFATGLADPQGFNFEKLGYTGYLLDHLKHYSDVAHSRTGALLVFGAYPGVHVTMVMQPDGDDPWLWSQGQQNGPLYIRLSEEKLAHVGQEIIMLDVSHLGK